MRYWNSTHFRLFTHLHYCNRGLLNQLHRQVRCTCTIISRQYQLLWIRLVSVVRCIRYNMILSMNY